MADTFDRFGGNWMSWDSRRPLRRGLALPAVVAIAAGAVATTTGLLSPQHAAALVSCPVLAENPQTYSTGEHCFTIPASVSSIHAVLVGGSGGAGAAGTGSVAAGLASLGGHGMQVSGDVAVTPGEVIWVYVGGNGADGSNDFSNAGAGGFNGGGQGGGNGDPSNYAGGGGGATDLRTAEATTPFTDCRGGAFNGTNLAAGPASAFILVAGGGGGGGNGSDGLTLTSRTASVTPDGGNGGSQPADANPPSAGSPGGPSGVGGGGGGAGTSSAGGAGGTGVNGGSDGKPGAARAADTGGCGGSGGNPEIGDAGSSGGGGGGGYNGGGGGGGGGSCVANASCIAASGIQRTLSIAVPGGGGGGGGGSDFHSSAVTGYTESIDVPGPSATITWAAATPKATPSPTPTGAVEGITTPSTGAGGSTLNVGTGILGVGAVLLGLALVGRRRSPGATPRPPA